MRGMLVVRGGRGDVGGVRGVGMTWHDLSLISQSRL